MTLKKYKERTIRKTERFIKKKAKEIQKKAGTKEGLGKNRSTAGKKKLAKYLYKNPDFKYGFDESVESSNYGPFPHELKEQANCLSFAAYNFFLAKSLGLDPRLYFAYDLENDKENFDDSFGNCNHAFIDVDVGTKKRLIIDPQLQMYGYVDYDMFNNLLKIKENTDCKNTRKRFERLEKLSISEIVSKLAFLKTPLGEIKTLEQGQFMKKNGVFYRFDTKQKKLYSRVYSDGPYEAKREVRRNFHFDEKGNTTGSDYEFNRFSDSGWKDYKNLVNIGKFDVEDIDPFLDSLEEVIDTEFKSKSWKQRKNSFDLLKVLEEKGIDELKVISKRLPDSIDKKKLKKAVKDISEVVEEHYDSIFEQENQELLKKGLAVNELYHMELKKRIKSKKDHDGYIFSQEERDSEYKKKIESWREKKLKLDNEKIDHISKLSFERKNIFLSMDVHRSSIKESKSRKEVIKLFTHKKNNLKRYEYRADILQYQRTMLKGRSTEELLDMVGQKGGDLYNSYKRIFMDDMMFALKARSSLNSRIHIPKIHSKIKRYFQYKCLKDFCGKRKDKLPLEYQKVSNIFNNPEKVDLIPRFYNMLKESGKI